MAQKNTKLIIDEQSKEYWRWRDSILTYEEVMLEALTFDLVVENPYQRLYEHLSTLDMVHNKRLRDSAWAFCNDACLTVLPLLMEARDISIAAVFFASTVTQSTIPDQNGEAWWRALNGNEDLLMKAIDVISDFYSNNPLRKQAPAPGSPKFDLESTRRKGEDMYFSQNGTPMGTDGGTQSPAAANSQTAAGADEDKEAASGDKSAARDNRGRGDSDAALKAAANDLDVHKGRPNGSDIKSPGSKRKLLDEEDVDMEGGRDSKRARTVDPDEDEDEGEVKSEA